MGIPAPTELLLILGIVVMVFGAKRIPEIMGGIGQGIKTFKKSLESDEEKSVSPQSAIIEAKTSQDTKPV